MPDNDNEEPEELIIKPDDDRYQEFSYKATPKEVKAPQTPPPPPPAPSQPPPAKPPEIKKEK